MVSIVLSEEVTLEPVLGRQEPVHRESWHWAFQAEGAVSTEPQGGSQIGGRTMQGLGQYGFSLWGTENHQGYVVLRECAA